MAAFIDGDIDKDLARAKFINRLNRQYGTSDVSPVSCVLCKMLPLWNRHHLVPKMFSSPNRQYVMVCLSCHKFIHKTFSNDELAISLNTLERLQENEQVKSYLQKKAHYIENSNQ